MNFEDVIDTIKYKRNILKWVMIFRKFKNTFLKSSLLNYMKERESQI